MARGTFTADVQKFVTLSKRRADVAVREAIVFLISGIDEASPVGNPSLWKHPAPAGYTGGRFRANNQLGVDVRPVGVLNKVDPTGGVTVKANIGEIPKEAAGHIYWIANNLPYAARLEFDHWSRQAPDGIYGRVALNFNKAVSEAAARAKAQVK